MASISGNTSRYVVFAQIIQQTSLQADELLVGAAYGDALGWLVYAMSGVMLTDIGRHLVRGDDGAIVSAVHAYALLAFPDDREKVVGRDAEDGRQRLGNWMPETTTRPTTGAAANRNSRLAAVAGREPFTGRRQLGRGRPKEAAIYANAAALRQRSVAKVRIVVVRRASLLPSF